MPSNHQRVIYAFDFLHDQRQAPIIGKALQRASPGDELNVLIGHFPSPSFALHPEPHVPLVPPPPLPRALAPQPAAAKKTRRVKCPKESESQDAVAADDAPSCVVCLENQPNCAVLSCMHKCLCCRCAHDMTSNGTKERGQVKCPLCKADAKKIKRVYE
jgi:hypothetical protein